MRWALQAVVAATLAVAVAGATAAVEIVPPRAWAAPTDVVRLFLPLTGRLPTLGRVDSCARAAPCPGGQGWVVHCGGFGRLRDAFARYEDGALRDVLAVGDGAATFDPRTRAWAAQIGRDLTGLESVYLTTAPTGGGWVVGERTRIARAEEDGCWQPDDRLINGEVELTGVVYDDPARGGWAVGRRGADGVLLRLAYDDGQPTWSNASGLASGGLPALSDFYLFNRSEEVNDAWLVSPETSGLVAARLGQVAGEALPVVEATTRVPLTDDAGRPGRPREIAMRSGSGGTRDEGWVVGEVPQPDGRPALVAWRYQSAQDWRAEFGTVGERLVGRSLVDLYYANNEGTGRWWLGLTPTATGSSVLRVSEEASASATWTRWDIEGPPGAPEMVGGHRAIAPLGGGHVLYGWGDGVWVYDFERPKGAKWVPVLDRRRLVAVGPRGSGAWLLADAGGSGGDGSRLLALAAGELRPVVAPGGTEVELPRLHALDDHGGVAWAVGDGGTTWVQTGTTDPWRPGPSIGEGVSLVDVAVARDGTAWALGHGSGDGSTLWRIDPTATEWSRVLASPATLHAVTALDGGRAWAVGDGAVCECGAGRCGCEANLRYVATPGEAAHELSFRAVAAADSRGQAAVWASGDLGTTSYLVRRSETGWRGAQARLLAGVPQGARIEALDAGAADDVWAVSVCRPFREPDRGVTIVSWFRGDFDPVGDRIPAREAMVLSVPVHDVQVRSNGNERAVWLAGDWSTLLSLRYRPGDPPPAADPPAVDLRCAPVP